MIEFEPLDPDFGRDRSARWRARRRRHLLITLPLLAVAIALAGPLARSSAIIDGPTTSAPSWAAAVVSSPGLCTGALVAPNVVLTAAHCSSPTRIIIGRSNFINGTDGSQADVARVIRHPQKDLAAVILDRSVPQAPIALGSDDPSADPLSFVPFTVYGYGRTNDMNEATATVDGTLRTAVGLVTSTCPAGSGQSAPSFCLAPQKTSAPCQGDSGAPLVAADHLMGIFTDIIPSSSDNRCSGAQWAAVSVPNGAIRKWVNDTISSNAS